MVIKNANITNSGYNNGPWNRHDLNFACDVELVNVVSDKAIALKANGTLTNVTINDANTSDTYALWIQPNGQTVTLDGCVIDMLAASDGRGIKIDDQYVDAPAKVTLNVANTTIKTEEKSAIIVKSKAGANINLSQVDISEVAADNVNAVWCDEASAAYYELISVNGATMVLEGNFTVAAGIISTVAQLQQFADAVNTTGTSFSGKTVKLVNDLDLAGIEWKPIGQTSGYSAKTYFQGVFDGNGKIIKNLNVSVWEAGSDEGKHYASGFFGFIDAGAAEIKNITFVDPIVKGSHWTGVVAGYLTGNIENCHIVGADVVCTHVNDEACGDKAGSVVGYINSGLVKKCSVSNSTVKAGRDAGQIVGAAKTTQVEACLVTNVTVSALGNCTGENIANDIIGRIL